MSLIICYSSLFHPFHVAPNVRSSLHLVLLPFSRSNSCRLTFQLIVAAKWAQLLIITNFCPSNKMRVEPQSFSRERTPAKYISAKGVATAGRAGTFINRSMQPLQGKAAGNCWSSRAFNWPKKNYALSRKTLRLSQLEQLRIVDPLLRDVFQLECSNLAEVH